VRDISQAINAAGNASAYTGAGGVAGWAANYEPLIMVGVSVASLVVLTISKIAHYLLEKNRATKSEL